MPVFLGAAALAHASAAEQAASAQHRTAEIAHKLNDPGGGVFIVAHRGCHNPYPARSLSAAPENSIAALENCIRLGIDMMETDIRRSKDGALVIMHDDTVDRTTNGSGRVGDLTLEQLRALRLRQNFGGSMSPQVSDERVLTLEQLLGAARGRIMLNLDIKEAIYPEVVAAVRRLGVQDQVLIKMVVDKAEPPLSDQAPYDQVPFIPILQQDQGPRTADFANILRHQASGRRRIPAVETVFLDQVQFAAVRQVAQDAHVRLWADTLTSVGVLSILGLGGDVDALRDPATWDRLLGQGVSVIQTDEPGPLLDYVRRRMMRTEAAR